MLARICIVAGLAAAALAQSVPNPSFRDTAVIPSFHRRNPEIVYFRTFLKQPVDGSHLLLVVRGGAPTPGWNIQTEHLFWSDSDLLGIFLTDRADENAVWEIAVMPGPRGEGVAHIERADRKSIVISITGNYGMPMPWLKVSFDIASKRETGRHWYTPPAVSAIAVADKGAYFAAESEAQHWVFRLLEADAHLVQGDELETALTGALKKDSRFGRLANGDLATSLPSAISPFGPGDDCRCENCPIGEDNRWHLTCTRHPAGSMLDTIVEVRDSGKQDYRLPPTSYEELAAVRPQRAEQGYGRDTATLAGQLGPYQLVGDYVWFAKLFYDGEGLTGVGGLGYFDRVQKQFTLFTPPEIVDWSASALLVEDQAVWVALVRHPEGAAYSGGLLRFDRATQRAKVFPVPDVMFELKSSEGGILAGTSNGLYIVRPERTVHISIEPTAADNWQAVTTVIPPGQALQP